MKEAQLVGVDDEQILLKLDNVLKLARDANYKSIWDNRGERHCKNSKPL